MGHDGVVLHSTDAGQSWTVQLNGLRSGDLMVEYYKREASASQAADPKRAEALVEEAKRFAAQGAENPLLDVWFSDASNGYVVGSFGLVFRTTDGGEHWEPLLHAVDNPKSLHLYSVRGIGNDVYIAGEQGLLLKLDREAKRFRALELPYKGTLFGVTGTERAVVAHGLRGSVLRSTDGGSNWQQVDTGLQVGMTASALDDDGRIVLVSQAGHVLASADDGASFSARPHQEARARLRRGIGVQGHARHRRTARRPITAAALSAPETTHAYPEPTCGPVRTGLARRVRHPLRLAPGAPGLQ